MNLSKFIPAGRTSLVKKEDCNLQVQTEYAIRPYPRLTTTISNNGQVLHKIEKKLEKAIDSFEKQSLMEDVIRKQHLEVVKIVKDELFNHNQVENIQDKLESQNNLEKAVIETTESELSPVSLDGEAISLIDKIMSIPGVKSIYQLDNDGNFSNKISGDQFKKKYSFIFKNLIDLIEIFALIPVVTITRQKGVYEVERNRLYMVSSGEVLYFVTIEKARMEINYEKAIKEFIDSLF